MPTTFLITDVICNPCQDYGLFKTLTILRPPLEALWLNFPMLGFRTETSTKTTLTGYAENGAGSLLGDAPHT